MSFTTALSGLRASSNLLSVTGNNISNANTTGFKQSRSEFGDVYVSSMGGMSATTPGAGVQVTTVAQQFGQGNLQFTDNTLDLAISGDGFFVVGNSVDNTNERYYTRNGALHTNQDGYVVNALDQPILAYAPAGDTVEEGFNTGVLQPLQIDTSPVAPQATDSITLDTSLDARSPALDTTLFNPGDPATYTHSTSTTVYDSQGVPHVVTGYYVKTADNGWDLYTYADGQAMTAAPTSLTYDTGGNLVSVNGSVSPDGIAPADLTFTTDVPVTPNPGADPLTITFDLRGSTQVGGAFSVNSLSQNGFPTGRFSGLEIDDSGAVLAHYSNGDTKPMGQVAVARFENPQGLDKRGDTEWGESFASGGPVVGVAGTGNFGSIKSGALEGANLELADQLVTLIVAQQSYQANAQTIQTENQITQTLLNLR